MDLQRTAEGLKQEQAAVMTMTERTVTDAIQSTIDGNMGTLFPRCRRGLLQWRQQVLPRPVRRFVRERSHEVEHDRRAIKGRATTQFKHTADC